MAQRTTLRRLLLSWLLAGGSVCSFAATPDTAAHDTAVPDVTAPESGTGNAAMTSQEKAPRERLPEEITVTGQKLFSVLNRQIRDAEDAMYGLFNELNDDNQYDIHCVWEAPLGTRIQKRNCRPEFIDRANREVAQDFVAQAQGFSGTNPLPVMAQAAYHYPILADKMKALVAENPDLLDAVVRHYELRKELEARKSAYFKND